MLRHGGSAESLELQLQTATLVLVNICNDEGLMTVDLSVLSLPFSIADFFFFFTFLDMSGQMTRKGKQEQNIT